MILFKALRHESQYHHGAGGRRSGSRIPKGGRIPILEPPATVTALTSPQGLTSSRAMRRLTQNSQRLVLLRPELDNRRPPQRERPCLLSSRFR